LIWFCCQINIIWKKLFNLWSWSILVILLSSGAVTNLRGHAEKEASAILFWEHIIAVISLAFWLILYIRILF
jgi:hypothetical protein